MKEVVVIGGGAAGLMCSLILQRQIPELVHVTILERLEKTGKKILATGNGRCNLTNQHLKENKYNDPVFVKPFLKRFGLNETLDFFHDLGLLTMHDDEGRYYPANELANAVLDVLRNEAKRLGIVEKCSFDVRKLNVLKDGTFMIESTRGTRMSADYVVLAAGGKATPVLGSNGSGLNLLKDFRLKIVNPQPGLVGVMVDQNAIKGLAGIRLNAKVSLYNKKSKEVIWQEEGEVLVKNDGFSGIVMMQLATQISRLSQVKGTGGLAFSLDLLPKYSRDEVYDLLIARQKRFANENNDQYLIGVFHRLVGMTLLRRTKIDLVGTIGNIFQRSISTLADEIKAMSFDIKGVYDFDKAHVTVGGLDNSEVVNTTLEVRKVPNLYVCGEILNVDGECGGYNLQWAWSSGYVVGMSIAEAIKNLHL